MFKWINKIFTRYYKEVPLFWVAFDLIHYKEIGAKDSCMIRYHPVLKDDQHIRDEMCKLIDYIRANYDMEKLSK